MHRKWLLLLAAPFVLAAACNGDDGPLVPVDTDSVVIDVRGHYSFGFEVVALAPCGSREKWWVSDPGGLLAGYGDVAEEDYESVYVDLRGVRGPLGEFGHLGAYQRVFEVTALREMRAAAPDDCR